MPKCHLRLQDFLDDVLGVLESGGRHLVLEGRGGWLSESS